MDVDVVVVGVIVFIFSREGQKHNCELCLGANVYSQIHMTSAFFLNEHFACTFFAVFMHGLAFRFVYMWCMWIDICMCVCVFVFATLFNITNMRTHYIVYGCMYTFTYAHIHTHTHLL